LESGFRCLDAFAARDRKRAEDHLPPSSPISTPSSRARVRPIRSCARHGCIRG
jgi:hypothetical protein